MGDFKGKLKEVKYKDVPGENFKCQEVKVKRTDVKEDTYAKIKRRANIEGLVDPELARILFFLPTQALIYIADIFL